MKRRHVIALSCVLAFLIISGVAFATSITPYITFDEAKVKAKVVKIFGTLESEVLPQEGQGITFNLMDEAGTIAPVIYAGEKPSNMEHEHTEGLVVEGRFDGETFIASQILVKCPSKYEEQQKMEGEAQ